MRARLGLGGAEALLAVVELQRLPAHHRLRVVQLLLLLLEPASPNQPSRPKTVNVWGFGSATAPPPLSP